jgi:hypothetical protein
MVGLDNPHHGHSGIPDILHFHAPWLYSDRVKHAEHFQAHTMMNKKGLEPWMKTMLALIFAAITLVLLFVIYTNLGQNFVAAFNENVLGRARVAPIALPGVGERPAEQAGLQAVITAMPSSPLCAFESIALSVEKSKLPENETPETIKCFWDMDIEEDGDGDGSTTNDRDKEGCTTTDTAEPPFGKRTARLSLFTSTGIASFANVNFNSSALCACDSRPECSATLGLKDKIINNGDVLKFGISKAWVVEDLHLKISKSPNVSRIVVDIGADGIQDYARENITSGTLVIQGQSLAERINALRAVCETITCEISAQFFVDDGFLQTLDADLPYNTIAF